ncbi:MAG: hypothetical protein BMS9Abin06_0196 [Gammaproteobacteria bacterium]|nr:MAG: hypothetical protein BMS9Abin06_0196 [Gammaproteobacteria bacterium]
MKHVVKNKITLDPGGVWRLSDGRNIQYSDGLIHERYLKKVFSEATDFSSASSELTSHIRDWPSEYHLSRRRSQLLNGFAYRRQSSVLEVGCGCGAITRFLGETFDDVVAVEGSFARAELARRRTADLDNVGILCAPFHEISFHKKFDLIFCIGVFEYSNVFVSAEDPYDRILQHFRSLLSEQGVLILAIENQFGLKYFSSSAEDHTQFMFDGVEDYPRMTDGARTFGYHELKTRLEQHFGNARFYYPYPDYKIPDCVLSERFFSLADASELISRMKSRDYLNRKIPLFNESLANGALARNNMLPFFANSFLVIAGNDAEEPARFDQLGILYGTGRTEAFQAVTRFLEDDEERVVVEKQLLHPEIPPADDSLKFCSVKEAWQRGASVHSLIARKTLRRSYVEADVFSEAMQWYNFLLAKSSRENGVPVLDGKFIDCIWRNVIISDGVCHYIDAEMKWYEPIPLSVLFIRAAYHFLEEIQSMSDVHASLIKGRRVSRIRRIAATLDLALTKDDFNQFVLIEAKIAELVHSRPKKLARFYISNQLFDFGVYRCLLDIKRRARNTVKFWERFTG